MILNVFTSVFLFFHIFGSERNHRLNITYIIDKFCFVKAYAVHPFRVRTKTTTTVILLYVPLVMSMARIL